MGEDVKIPSSQGQRWGYDRWQEAGGVWAGYTRPNTPVFRLDCVTAIDKKGVRRPGS